MCTFLADFKLFSVKPLDSTLTLPLCSSTSDAISSVDPAHLSSYCSSCSFQVTVTVTLILLPPPPSSYIHTHTTQYNPEIRVFLSLCISSFYVLWLLPLLSLPALVSCGQMLLTQSPFHSGGLTMGTVANRIMTPSRCPNANLQNSNVIRDFVIFCD